jgi:preprotein translocase subunit SecB
MTDQRQQPDAPPPETKADGENNTPPPLVVNAQYVKDLSFEAPAAPQVFGQLQRQQPNISVKVDVQARGLDPANHVYEVVLQIESECKAGDMTAFVIELSYGGVFSLNVAEENLRQVLLIECPRLLFPFARHVVATATLNGGFMPLMLGPIDFANLYQQQHSEQPGDVATV